MRVQVLETSCLTEAQKLIVDETVFNVVKLVDVVYHFLAGVVNEFLNVSAKGNTQTDVSFSREGCEGGRMRG